MTDKEFSATRARIRKIAGEWITHLGFRWWKVDLEFPRDDEGTLGTDDEHWEGLMRVHSKWEYQQVGIEFNMSACARLSDDDLRSHFTHELAHAMVGEMREWEHHDGSQISYDGCIRHEERVVCWMQKAFGWVYDAGFHAGEKSVKAKQVSAGRM